MTIEGLKCAYVGRVDRYIELKWSAQAAEMRGSN